MSKSVLHCKLGQTHQSSNSWVIIPLCWYSFHAVLLLAGGVALGIPQSSARRVVSPRCRVAALPRRAAHLSSCAFEAPPLL